jgi:3'(2'), 5'-bisphosphate nucleotidase
VTGPLPEELLPHVRALAEEAGEVIMGCFAEEMSVRRKADASPVSEADEAAERIILAGLAALTPDVPVVAEEAIAAGALPDISGRRFWLVDPLDGTREFLSRKGEFTVNVALIEDGRPTLGVVHAPAMELTFAAAGALPATRERAGGSPEPISARVPPAEGKVVVVSRSHSDKEALEAYLAGIRVASVVSAGSSIKFCLVACGEADLYPRLGRTMEWDTAAGHAVLAAAGGRVETLDGRPLVYRKAGFENPPFIARGKDT